MCKNLLTFRVKTISFSNHEIISHNTESQKKALIRAEYELIIDRTPIGQGRIGGRKRLMTQDVLCRAEAMLATGATRLQVANIIGVSEKTIYKYFPARGKDGVPDAG
ncbi:helix-turn-helix domain-containing protein [Pectobacterium carotovorum]|uniref:helix-turn-helix domain-containing protein n=1 Tax=Pectobacterium carotovorum TaxID=554 RepID=UPI001A919781